MSQLFFAHKNPWDLTLYRLFCSYLQQTVVSFHSFHFEDQKSWPPHSGCLTSTCLLWRTTEEWDVQKIRAAVGRFCLTSRLSSHMIEWNKSAGETLSSLLLLRWKGDRFSHLPDTFNSHCDLGLSCPRTSIANEFMKPFAERSTTTGLCHLAAGTEGSLLGPAGPWPSPWLWMGVQ